MKHQKLEFAIAALLTLVVSACSARGTGQTVQPSDRPGDETEAPASSDPIRTGAVRAHPQDVRFMRGMIVHHAQALDMTELVPERASREDVRRLATRIEITQQDEIARMQRWLAARGEPAVDAHASHGEHLMPGMLNEQEMKQLEASAGTSFDRLFLESMIRHHEGALVMVAELFATNHGAQDVELFQFASAVDADQRAEIARMRRMLESGR